VTLKEAVSKMTDAEKVRLLKRLNYLGWKYKPDTGTLILDNPERFGERLAGKYPEPKPE
jgi:hypothetical protein